MRAPAKVRVSPYAVRTVGSMYPAGGNMMATAMRQIPKMVAEVAMKSCILTFGFFMFRFNPDLWGWRLEVR